MVFVLAHALNHALPHTPQRSPERFQNIGRLAPLGPKKNKSWALCAAVSPHFPTKQHIFKQAIRNGTENHVIDSKLRSRSFDHGFPYSKVIHMSWYVEIYDIPSGKLT